MSVTNWAGNIRFTPEAVQTPAGLDELRGLVAGSSRVRALGTGHSFNRIADTDGVLVSVRNLPRVLDIDASARTARVSAGLRYGEVGRALQAAGLALPNTGSLPHISVAGACATGTHGSGSANPSLATSVRELTLIAGGGRPVTASRDTVGDDFDGYVLALGRLGVVTELILDVVPTYDIAQRVVVEVGDNAVGDHLGQMLDAAYSVSVFTTWAPDDNRIWIKERVDRPSRLPADLWGGAPAGQQLNPVTGMPAEFATQQLGRPGPWSERLPHFRMDFTPSSGDELQSEYLLPLEVAHDAWAALIGIRDILHAHLIVGEIRSIAGDPLWLSMTGGRDSVAFHFTWKPEPDGVRTAVAAIEDALARFGARPHWGKVFSTPNATLAGLYPRMADARRLIRRHDPDGQFGNDLVDGWLGLTRRTTW